ncbi:aminotransferase class I/II-fold pyridoxal phosphate-dependent enzyme [Flavobacteriaceae bacterium F08102]|nr:aminotransferase class I/II-fold pyridoxal phosphate-dependent enzyme [Flavobacteriaceae bacterium F08102]
MSSKHLIHQFPSRTIVVDGREMCYFGGTSYLGMASLPQFQALLFDQIKQWGTAYGSSRNANVQLAIYNQAEQAFASLVGSEQVICLSSGMLAGQLVLETLSEEKYLFFHHPQAHPAIKQVGSSVLFVNGNVHQDLQSAVKQSVVICADSMPALHTKPVDLSFLTKIHPNKEITLLLDESHALGVVGKDGSGLSKQVPKELVKRIIVVSSLGKSLGLVGGIIASDNQFIEAVRASAKYVSASGANPAYLGVFVQAQALYRQQRIVLKSHLDDVARHLKLSDLISFDQSYPVMYCKDTTLADVLYNHGIVIAKFKYPTYTGEMLRIVISAHHYPEDIKKLINTVNLYT